MTNVWKDLLKAMPRPQIADTRSGQAFTPARNILARGQAEQGDQAYLRSPVRDPGGGHALAQLSRRIGFTEPVPQAPSATGLGVQGLGQNPRSPTAGTASYHRNLEKPPVTTEIDPATRPVARDLFDAETEKKERQSSGKDSKVLPEADSSATPASEGAYVPPDPIAAIQAQVGTWPKDTKESIASSSSSSGSAQDATQSQARDLRPEFLSEQEKTVRSLQEQMEQMRLVTERHERAAQETREALERQAVVFREKMTHGGTYYGHAPAEEWIVEDSFQGAFTVTGVWYNVRDECAESQRQTHFRMKLFQCLKKLLPKEFTFGVRENDVAAIYKKLITLATQQADFQRMDVKRKLALCEKRNRPLLIWLQELYDLFDQLDGLRVPATVQDLRSTIMYSLNKDKRYSEVLRDIVRNPDWDIVRIRSALEAAAHALDDLVAPISESHGLSQTGTDTLDRRRRAKAIKKEKAKAAKAANPTPAAHPAPKGDGRPMPDAEKAAKTKALRERLAREICPQHLIGACGRGDSCFRRHVTQAELQKEAEDKGKAGGKANVATKVDTVDPKGAKESNNSPKTNQCFQFQNNGTCTYGDRCHFEHSPVQKDHMVRQLRAELELEETSQGVIVKGTGQIHSGLVQLAHNLPDLLSDLRGSPAQAFGIKGGRTRMQVLGVDPNEDSVCGQFAQTAEREGLCPQWFDWPDGKQEKRRARFAQANGAYQANALFDSGADVSITFLKKLIHGFHRYAEPHVVQGVGGINVSYKEGGYLVMRMQSEEKQLPVHYDPGETCTLVAGSEFDDERWHVELRDGSRFFLDRKELAHYPRSVQANQPLPNDFLSSLGPKIQGQRLHSQFPIPDKAFVPSSHSARVVTRSSASTDTDPSTPDAEGKCVDQKEAGQKNSAPSVAINEKEVHDLSDAETSSKLEMPDWLTHLDMSKRIEGLLIRKFDLRQSYLTSDQHFWKEHCPRSVSDRMQITIEIDLLGAEDTEEIDITADRLDPNSQRNQPEASHATAHSANRWTEQFRVFDRGRINKIMSFRRTNNLHQMRMLQTRTALPTLCQQTRTAFRGSSAGWGK